MTFLRFFPETYSFCECFFYSWKCSFPSLSWQTRHATLRCKVNRSENSVSDLLSLKKPGKLKVEGLGGGLSVVVRVRVSPGARDGGFKDVDVDRFPRGKSVHGHVKTVLRSSTTPRRSRVYRLMSAHG